MMNLNMHLAKRCLPAILFFILVLGVFQPRVWAPQLGYQNISELYFHTHGITVGGIAGYLLADFTTPAVNQSTVIETLPTNLFYRVWFSPTLSGAIAGGDWNLTIYYNAPFDTTLHVTVWVADINGVQLLQLFPDVSQGLPASNNFSPATIILGTITPAIALTAYRLYITLGAPVGSNHPINLYLDTPQGPSRLNMPYLTLDSVYPPESQTSTSVPSLTEVTLAAVLITVSAFATLTIIRRSPRRL